MWWTNQAHYPYFFNGEERKFNFSDPHFNRYLNIIEHYDRIVGAAVDTLRARGLYESTIVVIVGDHGEAFGQHKLYGHAASVFEESIRIPLILVNPKLFHGERQYRVSGQIDLAPTLLRLTGHPIPSEWLGGDLFDVGGKEQVFFFAPWSSYLFGTRIGNRKIIFNETQNRVELFDLARDPLEGQNLFQVGSTAVDSLRLQVAGWLQYQDRFVSQLFAQ
jgi:arylsulfatase A-like enzyme